MYSRRALFFILFYFFLLLPQPEAAWGRGSIQEAPQTAGVLLPSSEFLCLGTGARKAEACDIAYWCLSTIASMEYTVHTCDARHEATGTDYTGDQMVTVCIFWVWTITLQHLQEQSMAWQRQWRNTAHLHQTLPWEKGRLLTYTLAFCPMFSQFLRI